MKNLLKAVPIPIAGVMLALAALGNLWGTPGETIHMLFGLVAFIVFILLLLKILTSFEGLRTAMNDPVTASVSGTFTMGMMVLSVYAKFFIGTHLATYFWFLAIALHVLLILWFTVRYILSITIQKVFASYYIVFIGIVVASLTAPAFAMAPTVGTWAFWFGFVSLIILSIVITYRYRAYPVVAEPAKPLICIYAAPVSLCLAGYLQSVDLKSDYMVLGMLIAATLIYLMVLIKLPKLLKIPFYPSYAAFTFPFVITAIATKQATAYLIAQGYNAVWMNGIIQGESAIALVLVFYVLFRYFMAIRKAIKTS